MHLPWRPMAPGTGPDILTSVTVAETEALRKYAAGADVLEIGAAYGYSTVTMALAGAHVTSIDPHMAMRSYQTFMGNLAVYRVIGRVEVIMQESRWALPALDASSRRFDLIFIDGDHTEETVLIDVTWALKLLRPGGTLACHDYDENCCCPGVRRGVDETIGDTPGELIDSMLVVRP